jgi:hypothetical protein
MHGDSSAAATCVSMMSTMSASVGSSKWEEESIRAASFASCCPCSSSQKTSRYATISSFRPPSHASAADDAAGRVRVTVMKSGPK